MWSNRVVIVVQVILVTLMGFSKAYKYRNIPEDDDIYSKCDNKPSNVLDVNGLFDLSEFTITPNFYNYTFSGNTTLIWDIQLTDRIQAKVQSFKFERGSWHPTMYAMFIPNMCPIMYDENQYWYQVWLQHLTNLEDIKDKCLNVPGTKFIHSQFEWDLIVELGPNNLDGNYKIEVSFDAFDAWNRMRPTSICIGFRMEFVSI